MPFPARRSRMHALTIRFRKLMQEKNFRQFVDSLYGGKS